MRYLFLFAIFSFSLLDDIKGKIQPMSAVATLHLLCGKMAAGKSTLARKLQTKHDAILIVEDEWLTELYPEEISSIPDYIKYSLRLKAILTDHVKSLLLQGVTVVLDFPANTINQRESLRALFKETQSLHVLHYLDVSDEVCKGQLRQRSKDLPAGTAFASDAEFDVITRYFQPPSDEEGFTIVRY